MTNSFQERVTQEIIFTEETYLLQLDKLQNFFSKPILESGLLPSHIHSAIFGQIPAIYRMNGELLEQLKSTDNIGLAFLKLGPFLKVYASYANNFQKALSLLQEWEVKNSYLKTFISQNETRPEVQLKLTALLITPVQRIPRYRLLLEELLKHTESSHSFYNDIKGALDQISNVAKHINCTIENSIELQYLLSLQKALRNQTPQIIEPGRKLVREGILKKVSRSGNGSQSRLFFLFNDMIMYTTVPNSISSWSRESSENDLKANCLECCCILPLRYCRVTTLFGGGEEQGITFRLQCSDEDLVLFSECSNEGKEWISAIKDTAKEALNKRKTLRKESSHKGVIRRHALRKQRYMKENSPGPCDSESAGKTFKEHLLSARDCLLPPKSWLSPKRSKSSPQDKKRDIYPASPLASNYHKSESGNSYYNTRGRNSETTSPNLIKSPGRVMAIPSRALSPKIQQKRKNYRPLSDTFSPKSKHRLKISDKNTA